MIPQVRLTTDRLVLRAPAEGDYAACADFMRSERAEFVGGPIADDFTLWRSFLSGLGHWALRGYGMFMVEHDGRCVGRVGVIYHAMWEEPELGWQLFAGHEGNGYATEAAIAARRWAAAVHGLGPLISYIAADNARSLGVARRIGAHFERDTTLLGGPCQLWRHPAADTATENALGGGN